MNPEFIAKATNLHDCWIDYGYPIRLKRLQWAEDIDDACREKLEQLLRVYVDGGYLKRKHYPFANRKGGREWLTVADEYRAAREATPE